MDGLGGRVTMTSPNVSLFLEMGEITIGGVPQNVSQAKHKRQCWFLNGFLVFTVGTLLAQYVFDQHDPMVRNPTPQ